MIAVMFFWFYYTFSFAACVIALQSHFFFLLYWTGVMLFAILFVCYFVDISFFSHVRVYCASFTFYGSLLDWCYVFAISFFLTF